MISLRCGKCAKDLKVKDGLAGKRVKCPACGQVVAVPGLEGATHSDQGKSVVQAAAEDPTLAPSPPSRAEDDATHGDAGDEANAELWDFLAPATQPDEIGRLGPYRVLKVLGAGGMGVVFRAEDPGLQRIVALKAMLPALARKAESKQRFFREARAAAALKHTHIVTIHQVGEDRGAPYLAMEFLEGEPLDARLKRETKLPVPLILRFGRQIAEGLAAAHAKGLIHRDIKPANIWLESSADHSPLTTHHSPAHVKILDFGLARAMGDQTHLTQSGAIIGTPAYMAPEQAGGKPVDHRSDLFSLGCVLYRMATGELPFKGNDTISILSALALESPSPPMDQNPEMPVELSDLVMRLLEKKPEQRFASAREVVEVISNLERNLDATQVIPAPKTKTSAAKGKVSAFTGKYAQPGSAVGNASAPKNRTLFLVGIGGALVAAIVAAIFFLWPAPSGTVRIEINDPAIKVAIDQRGFNYQGVGKHDVTLAPGEHGLKIKHGDLEFDTDKFVLKKGETITLKLEVLGGKMLIVQDGQVIVAKKYTNSLGMEFVLVPKGKSWLGGGSVNRGTNEVEIAHDFYLGVYEVTQEEWEKVMEGNPSTFKAVPGVTKEDQKRFPVETVSWDDAQGFIERLNKKLNEAGWVYRLPTEAEWEYACRGGPLSDKLESAFDFFLGKPTNQLLPEQANFDNGKGLKRTCKVGSHSPNRLGLFDMHGNVAEWCDDSDKAADGASPRMIYRGGAWTHDSDFGRAAYRRAELPFNRSYSSGVRLARVPVGAPAPAAEEIAAAEWVLSKKGFVTIRMGGKDQVVNVAKFGNNIDKLPKGPYTIVGVNLSPSNAETLPVNDNDLRQLACLKQLESLDLGRQPITTAGLAHLAGCSELKALFIYSTGIGLDAIPMVGKFSRLEKFMFPGDAGNDQWAEAIAKLPAVRELTAYRCDITDAGVAHLSRLPKLEKLSLDDVGVTDASLKSLAGCRSLRTLQLGNTNMTVGAMQKLKQALPECQITHQGKPVQLLPPGARFTNALGMEFALVPKGKSWLGGAGGKPGDKEVEIKQDFYLGVYEVTQEEWEKVMESNPSTFKAGAGVAKEDQKRFPVEMVSWEDAQLFIERLNKKVKEADCVYRLPKEAEWEYACRGGPMKDQGESAFDFYFEKPTNQLLPELANFDHGKGMKRTCKVGSYQPNRLGLYDMHGNVWEWCDDLFDPKDPKPASPRVLRGGGWDGVSGDCRAANRFAHSPSNRHSNLGLRLARVPVGGK